MAFLYGSSNVYRHYTSSVNRGLEALASLELVECTRRSVLDTHIANLKSPSFVVTSVLENFICDACTGENIEEFGFFGNQVITRHVEQLADLVSKWPGLIVAIVPPKLRNRPDWFPALLPGFSAFLTSEVTRVACTNMRLFCPFTVASDMLLANLVHLNRAAGSKFMDYLKREISAVKPVAVEDETIIDVDVSEDEDETLDPTLTLDEKLSKIFTAVSGSSSRVKKINSRLNEVASSHALLDTRLTARRKQDNLVFARLKEEADYETNRSREDRVVITGLAPLRKASSTHKEKKGHYVTLIGELVKLAVPGIEPPPRVLDVYLTVKKERAKPVVEAKFDSVGGAIQFRTEAAKLSKEDTGRFAGLFFTNSATLSTRVRIEIMRAIALKLKTETEDAYVQGFISRPLLHYRSVDPSNRIAGGADRSYTFVDAISRFGDLLMDVDLTSSYARAGHTFHGAMEHYFIVLSEGRAVPARPAPGSHRGRRGSVGGRTRGGRKRFGDSLAPTPSKKKAEEM